MPGTNIRRTAVYRYWGPNERRQDRCATIDEETALWAARMCVGEGGIKCSEAKASAMLWAMMNRWFLHPTARRNWSSYLLLLQRFSQPINPKWQPGGELAQKHAGTKDCTPVRLKRRAWVFSLPWKEIPAPIEETIRAFQAGRLPPPDAVLELEKPRISNWSSDPHSVEKYPWGVRFDRSLNGEWFFQDARLIRGRVVVDFF